MTRTRRQYIAAVGAVGTAAISGCGGAETTAALDDETTAEYVGVASGAATRITEWDERSRETIRELAAATELQTGTRAERQQFLVDRSGAFPDEVHQVHLVAEASSEIVASSAEFKQGGVLNSREAPWASGDDGVPSDGDEVFVAEPTEALGIALVSFATPVQTDDAAMFLVLQTNLDALSERFPSASDGSYTLVIDAAGRIITGTKQQSAQSRNDGELTMYDESTDPSEQPVIQRGLDGESGVIQGESVAESLDGDYVVAFAPVPGFEWVVATHIPESEV